MSEADTQTVASTTEAPAVPVAEEASAQNTTSDLDSLLREFDVQTKPQPAPVAAAADTDSEILNLKREVLELKQRDLAAKETTDLSNAIKEVKGNLDVPDYVVDGWIGHMARNVDPRIRTAWEQRDKNPAAYKKVLNGLKSQFVAEQTKKRPDPEVTSDKLAVAAAVRGTSTKVPDTPAPRYGSMTDAEFAAEKAKYGV